MMTRDGRFVVDGVDFVPSILYHVGDESTWEQLHAAGINLLQTTVRSTIEETVAHFDKMHAAGLKVALVLYHNMKPAGSLANKEFNRQLILAVKDHPALFCYMTMDEPYAHYGDKVYADYLLAEGYKLIKEYDNVHPVYHCECITDMYESALKFVDVMGIDPYPSNLYSYETHVADMTAKATDIAKKYGKGVTQVLQVFTYGGINPDATRVHSMMYQSAMGGAIGNGYYPWLPDDPALDPVLGESRHWQVMTDFYEREHDIVWRHYAKYGDTLDFVSIREAAAWIDVWAEEECFYAAVLNRRAAPQQIEIPLTDGDITLSECDITAVTGDVNVSIKKEDGFTADMPAGAAALFKIVPKSLTGGRWEFTDLDNKSAAAVCPMGEGRLIIAGYIHTNEGLLLCDVSVASPSQTGFASVRLSGEKYDKIKAFLWK